MKRLLLFAVLAVALTTGLKAEFFAYQEWENPTTGEVIHEYYDVHTGNSEKQRQDFVWAVKKTNGIAIIEDMESRYSWLSFTSKGFKNSKLGNALDEKASKNSGLDFKKMFTTPLSGLHTLCKQNGVRSVNVECRNGFILTVDTDLEKELLFYNDGPVLTHYYKSLRKTADAIVDRVVQSPGFVDLQNKLEAQALLLSTLHPTKEFSLGPVKVTVDTKQAIEVSKNKLSALARTFSQRFIRGVLLVDARMLHISHNTPEIPHKHIAGGGMHLYNINKMLFAMGWKPKPIRFSASFEQLLAKNDKSACSARNYLNDYTTSLEDSEVAQWATTMQGIANTAFSIMQDYPIDIRAIYESQEADTKIAAAHKAEKMAPAQLLKSKL